MKAHDFFMLYQRTAYINVLLLFFWSAIPLAVADNVVHCKMKPGCTTSTQCDPIPKRWFERAYKIEDYLFKKEFPISCTNNDLDTLQKDIKALNTEIRNLKFGNRDLKKSLGVVQAELFQTKAELQKERSRFDEESRKMNRRILKLEGNCLAFHKNKCLLAITTRTKKSEGQRQCAEMGGQLADINGETLLTLIMNIVREKLMDGKFYVHLWLGMTYDPLTNKVFLSDGTEAKYKKWVPGSPTKKSGHTSIVLLVAQSSTNGLQYMWNNDPSWAIGYPLCEI